MYTRSMEIYDKLYSGKDYRREAEIVASLVAARAPHAKTLLDVDCGTGKHLSHLRSAFQVEGVDVSPEFVELSRKANPGVRVRVADMVSLRLAERYDVVVCLFSAIGFVRTPARLKRAVRAMARHITRGGLLIVEPWFEPADWHPGRPNATIVDEPDVKIARLTTSEQKGICSVEDLHYLVATPQGTRHFVERFIMGLFTQEQMLQSFADAGLKAEFVEGGLTGRGL